MAIPTPRPGAVGAGCGPAAAGERRRPAAAAAAAAPGHVHARAGSGSGSGAAGGRDLRRIVNASATWAALGTTAAVVVTEPGALAAARAAVEAELRAIDAACTRFRADASWPRSTRPPAGRRASARCWWRRCDRGAGGAPTGGAVDPTVGAAVIAPGTTATSPLCARRAAVADGWAPGADWPSIVLAGPNRLPAGVRLDLGATAKALAADRAAPAAAAAAGAVCWSALAATSP